jgi:hypothetical protein
MEASAKTSQKKESVSIVTEDYVRPTEGGCRGVTAQKMKKTSTEWRSGEAWRGRAVAMTDELVIPLLETTNLTYSLVLPPKAR